MPRNLTHARAVIRAWATDFNETRPHSAYRPKRSGSGWSQVQWQVTGSNPTASKGPSLRKRSRSSMTDRACA